MTWLPANSATDIRPIVGNVLQFFRDHQTEALAWASPLVPLVDFVKFYPNAEFLLESQLKTVPHFGIVRRSAETDDSDSGKIITYTLTWQFEVRTTYTEATRTTKLAALQAEIDNRAYALESMFMNIPAPVLYANLVGTRHGHSWVSKYDPIEMAINDTEAFFNVQQIAVLNFTENP